MSTRRSQLSKMNKDQISKSEYSSTKNVHNFEEFLSDLLTCIFSGLNASWIQKELMAILGDLKVQIKQGVDKYISVHLVPELTKLIESKCGISPTKQLMSLKPFIMRGLETFLEEGRILNMNEVIQQAKTSLPEVIIETALPNASESTKSGSKRVMTTMTITAFDKGLTKDVITNAVPDLKVQIKQGVDKYVSVHLVPELTKVIESKCGISPTKQLMSLKPFIIRGLETFLDEGRILNKKEIIQQAKRSLPEVIIETALPNASESTKTGFKRVMATMTITAFDKGLTKDIVTNAVPDLKVLIKQEVDKYVSVHLVPELTKLIESKCGVSPTKQLMSLKPFIMKGLETFLDERRRLNKNEIIQLAKRNLPEIIIETALPNASESTKSGFERVMTTMTITAFDKGLTKDVITNAVAVAATEILIPEASQSTKNLVQKVLNLIKETVFNSDGTTPSVEKLFNTLLEQCGDEAFCLAQDKLTMAIDELIEKMPEDIDHIMEFLVKHGVPALSVCFEATAFSLVLVFLIESFERLREGGSVKGSHLAKPLTMTSCRCVVKAVHKKVTDNAIEKASTAIAGKVVVKEVVAKEVVTKTISRNIVEKCVVKKAGGKAVVETTRRLAEKTSKKVITKATQSVSTKAASTGSQVTAKQSVKVSTKAVQSISVKATNESVKVVGKATQKASVKIAKNLGDGISEVTKKATIKKSIKTTLTETAEGVTTTTTRKVAQKSVSKTTTQISQTSLKAAAKVGLKHAAAGLSAAGISATVGGFFLYRDLKKFSENRKKGVIDKNEYKKQKGERIGEFAGDVIGSGIFGAAVSIAALSGPAGWVAIGVGALCSHGTGKLGGKIAKAIVSR